MAINGPAQEKKTKKGGNEVQQGETKQILDENF